MKLQKIEIFHTPKNIEEIHDWIKGHDKETEAHLWILLGMFSNFIADQQENETLNPADTERKNT